jgi:hypothetical protein
LLFHRRAFDIDLIEKSRLKTSICWFCSIFYETLPLVSSTEIGKKIDVNIQTGNETKEKRKTLRANNFLFIKNNPSFFDAIFLPSFSFSEINFSNLIISQNSSTLQETPLYKAIKRKKKIFLDLNMRQKLIMDFAV